MPATDTYLCYSVPGEWTKYTVHVAEAGMYSISCVMGVTGGMEAMANTIPHTATGSKATPLHRAFIREMGKWLSDGNAKKPAG